MKVFLAGVRGTAPVTGPAFARYGGATTCLLVEGGRDARILVDAGSGARAAGARLLERPGRGRAVLVLLTHYHLDHLIGLPGLAPLYRPGWRVDFAAPRRAGVTAAAVVRKLLGPPFWPVGVDRLPARVRCVTLPGRVSAAPRPYRGLTVRWCALPHPDGCTAYRVDEPATGTALVVATDCEWRAATPRDRAALRHLCRAPRPADLLLCDGHYTPAEYARHRGWGHNSWRDAAELAAETGARRLWIVHHAPDRTDRELDLIRRAARRAWPGVEWAREGRALDLPGSGARR